MFQAFCFNESLTTFKKAAAEHEVLARLPILDAGYQQEMIITTTLATTAKTASLGLFFPK